MTTTVPGIQVPTERFASLQALLVEYGPYRQEQLRQQLLSAAQQQRDEADHLRRSADAFRRTAPLRQLRAADPQPPPTPERCEREAAILQQMAAYIASYRGR